jgi:tetratricopeptide (TPR) repeat protein
MCRRWLALLACAWSLLEGRAAPAQTSECLEEAIAQIKSVQGESVQIWRASTGTWSAAKLDTLICAGDYIYVGERSRAAAQMRKVETVVSFDENTTILLGGTPQTKSLLMEILEGAVNFLSRVPQPMDIHTPFVNAGVEGTEFEVRVVPDRQRSDRRQRPAAGTATVSVFEGKVRAGNASGSVQLASGQTVEARVCPPQPRSNGPPECATPSAVLPLRIDVTPPGAVRWALYYPPVYAEPGRATTPALVQASRLISVGQVDEAAAILAQVPDSSPAAAEKYALLTVIAVTRNERQRALDLGRKAVKLGPASSSPSIALSYAEQANFDLEAARDTLQRAVEVNPNDALAWARLAEVWLSLGYRDRSLEAAEKAAKLAPKLSRTQTVLGFAALAQIDLWTAISAFSRAIALDSADPLPRLGFGLARIRRGELVLGRQEIEIAAALDPRNSLIRSYLGKAYFEEKRDPLDGTQFDLAKKYDPNDPTPWLYDAIRKETENRPVEALHDIQKSIELNDNRAVYRSQLLLDKDRAARGTSLGRIYDDLGFQELGVLEASKSLTFDPANASAHRFLSDIYTDVHRREIARVSELLQAQLLQDININPIQPSLSETNLSIVTRGGPAQVGFNEFTPLFESDQIQLNTSGLAGTDDTFGGEGVISALYEQLSLSGGAFHFETDGWRPNSDINHDVYDLYSQYAITPELNAQMEFRHRESTQGDLAFNFNPNPTFPNLERSLNHDIGRAGFRYSPTPNSDLLLSFIYSDREEEITNLFPFAIPGFGNFNVATKSTADDEGYQVEAQYLYRRGSFNLTTGFGYTGVNTLIRDFSAVAPAPLQLTGTTRPDITYPHGYVYSGLNFPDPVNWTLGISVDDFKEGPVQVSKVNPKLGMQWDVTDNLRLRGAVFRTVKPALVSNRTIEPTQIAGFNQFFDDANGTEAWRWGAGLDWRLTNELFVGAEATWRSLKVPMLDVASGAVTFEDQDEQSNRAYVFWTPLRELALSAEFVYDRFEAEEGIATEMQFSQIPTKLETISVPLAVRYFHPSGFFAGAGLTYVHQDVERSPTTGLAQGTDQFVVVDAAIGWRFPNRVGIASLAVTNLLDQKFLYQDDNFRTFEDEPSVSPYIPDRQIMGRVTLNF